MKPLYLNGKTGMAVALDGPALRVRAPERAATYYPLRRLSRVIASGPVEWSTAALLACAERGITVTFLGAEGEIRAYLFGESTLREGLFLRLRNLLDRPDWLERYECWQLSEQSFARRSLCRRLKLAPDALSLQQLEGHFSRLQRRFTGGGHCWRIQRRLSGLTAGLTAELLNRAGMSAEQAQSLGYWLDLPGDITRLLALDLQLPLLESLSSTPGGQLDDKELVQLFESRTARLERLGRSILGRLHHWLVEMVA